MNTIAQLFICFYAGLDTVTFEMLQFVWTGIYRIFEFTEIAYHSVNFLILKILIPT